jgi:hypothetical protein
MRYEWMGVDPNSFAFHVKSFQVLDLDRGQVFLPCFVVDEDTEEYCACGIDKNRQLKIGEDGNLQECRGRKRLRVIEVKGFWGHALAWVGLVLPWLFRLAPKRPGKTVRIYYWRTAVTGRNDLMLDDRCPNPPHGPGWLLVEKVTRLEKKTLCGDGKTWLRTYSGYDRWERESAR